MSEIRDRLTKLRQQEQETRGYGTSSAWYTALRPAISYLELAEAATNPAEKFRNAWNAVYNLSMMMHRRGEIENITFTHLITEVEAASKVRSIALATPTAFLEALRKAQTTLLFDAESKKPRESKQLVEIWLDRRKKSGDISPEKACTYLFLIGRDLRNALSHPKLDPNSPVIKRALAQAAEIFIPLAIATTEAIIERPPEGTTGRVIAYRSFLYPFLKNSDSPFSDYYLERLFPEQELSAFPELEAREDVKAINRELETLRGQLARADADETLQRWCLPVLFQKLSLTVDSNVKIVADDGVFEPTAVIKKAELQGRPRHEYKAKDAGRDLACLIWVLPWSVSLDAVSRDEQFASLTMLEVAQRSLSRADVDWAILTNGQQVRLLSKTTSHKARTFMEVDLVAIVERRGEREAQLAFRYLLGLCSQASIVERDTHGHTRLERALRESERHGREISKELKENVFTALEELGKGFLAYMQSQPDELDSWRAQLAPSLSAEEFFLSQELLTDIYQESLSLMYRLLFLFYAEGRDLLPMDEELYRDTYSLESIRDDIIVTHDDPSPTSFFSKGEFNLWSRLKELFDAVDGGWRNIIPAYNGGLFDSEQHQFLEKFKINDNQLASAIDLLSRTKPGSVRGEGRKKVTYRDLDIRHLGSIYEGILEYHAEIADQEKVVIKRGTSGKTVEEYVNSSELKAEEHPHLKSYRQALKDDEENPSPPRGCKVTGLIEPGDYYLIYGGRESKRKSSGSYYTPDYIVQYIVDNTLGPLVRGECRPKPAPIPELLKGKPGFEEDADDIRPLSGDEILELKVLDPAMGSGHFLVAATEYLARAYGSACIREGKDKDGVMSDGEFVHYKRIIAERCIYGVDINPMAMELAKLSMWLFTMDKGRPLSFVNHHLKCGNTLIGAWTRDLGVPPEYDEKGRLRKRGRRDTRTGNLFETRFRERVPTIVRDLLSIMENETTTIADIKTKKSLENTIDRIKEPFKNVADIWVGLHFGARADDYNALLVDLEQARTRKLEFKSEPHFFHWELEFPEVWFSAYGERLNGSSGFSAVIGNPPYVRVELLANEDKKFLKTRFSTIVERSDIYTGFIDQAIQILRNGGRLGFIVSGQFITADYGTPIKTLIENGNHLSFVIDLEPLQIFEGSTTYPIILGCEKSTARTLTAASASTVTTTTVRLEENEKVFRQLLDRSKTVQLNQLNQSPWLWARSLAHSIPKELTLLAKHTIKDIGHVSSSLKTGKDAVLTAALINREENHYVAVLDGVETRVSKLLWKPMLRVGQLSGWHATRANEVAFFPYRVSNNRFILMSEEFIKEECLATYSYLSKHRNELEERRDSRKTWREHGRPWYSLHRIGTPKDFEPPRLLSPGEFSINRFALSLTDELWPTARIIGISKPLVPIGSLQLYLNSDEVWAFMKAKFPARRGGYRGMAVGDLESVPCASPTSPIWEKLEEISKDLDLTKIEPEIEDMLRKRISAILQAFPW
jgi:type I restriction-modification system DNA methylase subunit